MPRRGEGALGLSPEDLWKPASVQGKGKNSQKLCEALKKKKIIRASHGTRCPRLRPDASSQHGWEGQASLDTAPLGDTSEQKPYEKESHSTRVKGYCNFSYSFIQSLQFSFSKYKNTTTLMEIYTLVVLVHKKAKYLQNYTV